jgi:hypothetical protein
MTRHLHTCDERARDNRSPEKRGQARHMHLVIDGTYNSAYWMHVELPASAVFGELDYFLRSVWLECCGHLSQFSIGRTRYVSYRPETALGWGVSESELQSEVDMWSARLSAVLAVDSRFAHEYDFGTSTYLNLRVVSERRAKVGDGAVRVLARNEPPDVRCGSCDQSATKVCSMCSWDETGWLCDQHARAHDCGWEGLLPVVNSPRTGMCAYVGPVVEYTPPTIIV